MRLNHSKTSQSNNSSRFTRRTFLETAGMGIGSIVLNELLQRSGVFSQTDNAVHAEQSSMVQSPSLARPPHFPARAKRIIYLFMGGAPSHLDLLDYKPALARFDGQLPPDDVGKFAIANAEAKLLGSRFKFNRFGKSGAEISELLPHLGSISDDVAIIRSMHTDASNHAPGQIQMTTGVPQFGRPSMGSWVSYGLGTEADNLPSFVVLNTGVKNVSGGTSCWGNGFLPSTHQGVLFRNTGDPILYLANPPGIDAAAQRDSINSIRKINEMKLAAIGDNEIATRINSFELAFKMQSSAPELMDLTREPQHILDLYGVKPGENSFASACLLARRMSEQGVRFVQIFHEAWDHHSNLQNGLRDECRKTDQASAALIKDLKSRGLLDDTLVIWGGEFGRTPTAQGGMDGRDHHPGCFSMWMAGAGIKPGITFGSSDELGFKPATNPIHVNDLHATILHLLGMDHLKFTYRSQGRHFRLTDLHGNVVRDLMA